MLQNFYVNNFRCLENFTLRLEGQHSALLVGKNGAGKSTVAHALSIMQRIGRGVNRVEQLVEPLDQARGKADVPIRFELEALLGAEGETIGGVFKYTLAFELPEKFRKLRVREEKLTVNGETVFDRNIAQVTVPQTDGRPGTQFSVDWHLVALPIIQSRTEHDPVQVFKTWLARMIILAPIPSLLTGYSTGEETLHPESDGSNFGEWFSCLLSEYPAAYLSVAEYLKSVGTLHDFGNIKNPLVGAESKRMTVQFGLNGNKFDLPLGALSDGEKCLFVCAVVLAANEHYGPLFCFWDEPDNFLSLSDVGHFVAALRRAFASGGQFLATSHSEEVARRFSGENTWVLDRKSHFEPTLIKRMDELDIGDDKIGALIRGDVTL